MKPLDNDMLVATNGGGAAIVRDIGQFCGGFWEGVKIFGVFGYGNLEMDVAMGIVAAQQK